jgi:hypothetical protein
MNGGIILLRSKKRVDVVTLVTSLSSSLKELNLQSITKIGGALCHGTTDLGKCNPANETKWNGKDVNGSVVSSKKSLEKKIKKRL